MTCPIHMLRFTILYRSGPEPIAPIRWRMGMWERNGLGWRWGVVDHEGMIRNFQAVWTLGILTYSEPDI